MSDKQRHIETLESLIDGQPADGLGGMLTPIVSYLRGGSGELTESQAVYLAELLDARRDLLAFTLEGLSDESLLWETEDELATCEETIGAFNRLYPRPQEADECTD